MINLFRHWDRLKKELGHKHIMLFLDYDGTLTPIVETPEKAVISKEAKGLIEKLSRIPNCKIAIISGRALRDVKRMVALKGIIYVGNHGLEIEGPKIKFESQISPSHLSIIKLIKKELDSRLSAIKGVFVEDKNVTLSIHYRLAHQGDFLLIKKTVDGIIHPYAVREKIKIDFGKKVIEIKPPLKWNKGRITEWLLTREHFNIAAKEILPIYIGDDITDEDAFKALKNKGLTVFVGKPTPSYAQYYLENTQEVIEFLKRILQMQQGKGLCQN